MPTISRSSNPPATYARKVGSSTTRVSWTAHVPTGLSLPRGWLSATLKFAVCSCPAVTVAWPTFANASPPSSWRTSRRSGRFKSPLHSRCIGTRRKGQFGLAPPRTTTLRAQGAHAPSPRALDST